MYAVSWNNIVFLTLKNCSFSYIGNRGTIRSGNSRRNRTIVKGKGMENIMEATGKEKGMTGSSLKMIAIITMFIDHTAAVILERMLYGQGLSPETMNLYIVYMVMRLIGRLGFPIFCFLLIEGFCYTRNVKKYALRLFLFALISEVPFDLGFIGNTFYWQYQNVFFTLFIGLLVLTGFRFAEEKIEWGKPFLIVFDFLVLAAGMYAADWLMTDYGGMGVLTIAAMYLFRKNRVLEAGIGCAVLTMMSLNEITAFFVLIPIHKYNGKRGWNLKWVFYVFYPLHILLLYLIAYAMGLGNIMLR